MPAPESTHAIRAAIDEALRCPEEGRGQTILFGLSGHGNFDLSAYERYLGGALADDSIDDAGGPGDSLAANSTPVRRPGCPPVKGISALQFLALGIIWGSSYPLIKIAGEGLSPGQQVLGRLASDRRCWWSRPVTGSRLPRSGSYGCTSP